MTDLAIRPEGDVAVPAAPGLQQWLTEAASAEQLARTLVSSFWIPAAYKPSIPPRASEAETAAAIETAVANATGAILFGWRLGLDPMTSLQQVYVVHGRPGMYAKMKVALAQAAGHRVWDQEYGPERCTVAGQRFVGGQPVGDRVTITVTMDDAKRAGWTSNAAYGKTPADMLWARAASRVVDRIAADTLHGLVSIEDLQDEPAPEPVQVVARVNPAALVAEHDPESVVGAVNVSTGAGVVAVPALTHATATTGRPPIEGEPPTEAVAEPEQPMSPAVRMIGKTGLAKLAQRFADLGIVAPDEGLALLSELTDRPEDRPVLNSRDLTAREAELVLDNLTADVLDQHRAKVMADLDAEAAALQAEAEQVAE